MSKTNPRRPIYLLLSSNVINCSSYKQVNPTNVYIIASYSATANQSFVSILISMLGAYVFVSAKFILLLQFYSVYQLASTSTHSAHTKNQKQKRVYKLYILTRRMQAISFIYPYVRNDRKGNDNTKKTQYVTQSLRQHSARIITTQPNLICLLQTHLDNCIE